MQNAEAPDGTSLLGHIGVCAPRIFVVTVSFIALISRLHWLFKQGSFCFTHVVVICLAPLKLQHEFILFFLFRASFTIHWIV